VLKRVIRSSEDVLFTNTFAKLRPLIICLGSYLTNHLIGIYREYCLSISYIVLSHVYFLLFTLTVCVDFKLREWIEEVGFVTLIISNK
jgi:hypothetical protein